MKRYKKLIYIVVALFAPLGAMAQDTDNSKFAVKASAGIGVGNGISITSPLSLTNNKSSVSDFGVDFGYTFWQKGKNSLDVNIGLGYMSASSKFGVGTWNYNYAAGPEADIDGNRYIRVYEIDKLEQKINTGYLTVPIYLSYGYHFSRRFSLHADVGLKLGFKMSSSISECSGYSYSYGLYPEYNDLKIDADWINGFGITEINKSNVETPEYNGLNATAILGIGAEIGIAGPVSLDLGVRYSMGLTDMYRNSYTISNPMTVQSAPISYTVAGGEMVRPLTGYMTKSALSQLAIQVGVVVRF